MKNPTKLLLLLSVGASLSAAYAFSGGGAAPEVARAESTPAPPPTRRAFAADDGGIRAAIDSVLQDLRECYRAQKKMTPELGDPVTVRFIVATDGQIKELSVAEEHLASPPLVLETCAGSVLSQVRFEPPAEPRHVGLPLSLAGS